MTESSFKSRVTEFWDWFSDVADRFFETIESGNCPELSDEVSETVSRLFPEFVWCFGPGPEDTGGHSFTLSGNGILNRQFLAEHWLSQAPKLEGWTFYSSRQPGVIEKEFGISIDEQEFRLGDTQFLPSVDEENEVVDLLIFNPAFDSEDFDLNLDVTFIFLDEVLGEHGTGQWIGELTSTGDPIEKGISIMEMRDFLHDLEIRLGWQKGIPTETFVGYQLNPIQADFPRSDILFGSTCNFRIVSEHLESGGEWENPLADAGAEFIYVEFDVSILPEGSEVDYRANIADAINDKLMAKSVGQHLGGAFGSRKAYIDFLLFDTESGIQIFREDLEQRGLPAGTAIHFFAKENREHSILI